MGLIRPTPKLLHYQYTTHIETAFQNFKQCECDQMKLHNKMAEPDGISFVIISLHYQHFSCYQHFSSLPTFRFQDFLDKSPQLYLLTILFTYWNGEVSKGYEGQKESHRHWRLKRVKMKWQFTELVIQAAQAFIIDCLIGPCSQRTSCWKHHVHTMHSVIFVKWLWWHLWTLMHLVIFVKCCDDMTFMDNEFSYSYR